MDRLIRTIRRYRGRAHVGLRENRVVILRVFRADQILESDEAIGRLRHGDVIEFAPLTTEVDGSERMSWVTSDGYLGEFGSIEGWYEGEGKTHIVMTAPRAE